MQTPRAPVAGATLIAGALLMGCTSPPLKSVQEGGWVCSVRGARCDVGISLAVARQVDVLFVVDSSATMAEEQRKLAAAIPALTRALDRKRAELRVGVTTADMGNPRCAGDEYRDPDRGRLVQASCRDRLGPDGDFVFDSLGVAAEFACTDYCDAGVHAALQGGLTPTEIYDDDSVAPRPWYEHGVLSNLPAGVVEATAALPENNDADPNNDVSPLAAALRCGLPQGVNGCGFESPLESMFWALRRAQEPTEASFGFLRDAALLGVALVTDELDCSFNPAQELIFVDLNSTWAWEPGAVTPTSAVCWNAGVVCAGEAPGPYVGCTAADYDIDGALILDGSQDERAVLYPLARYIDELDAIENYKKMIDQNQEVFVSLLAGVPEGYAEGAAELEYRDDDDAEAHALYGIGPGCDGDGGPARPPVRMRELVEAFATGEEQLIHSVCAPDFDAAIERFADALADELRPACMKSCVADTDPDTPVLDADCDVVHESAVTGTRATVLECEVDPSGALTPPTDETICYALRHDAEGLTASPLDDMSPECVEQGWNLEFEIVFTEPLPLGSSISPTCVLSDLVQRDCPNL